MSSSLPADVANTSSAEPLRIALPLTVYSAAEARECLLRHLEAATPPPVDLSEIGECDTLGVQLLWSAQATAKSQGKPLVFLRPSARVLAACQAIGLEPRALGIEEETL